MVVKAFCKTPGCQICADQHRLSVHARVPRKFLNGFPPAVQGYVAMVAAGVDVLLPQKVLCGAAAIQCVAEHHHAPPLCHVCSEHLRDIGSKMSSLGMLPW